MYFVFCGILFVLLIVYKIVLFYEDFLLCIDKFLIFVMRCFDILKVYFFCCFGVIIFEDLLVRVDILIVYVVYGLIR